MSGALDQPHSRDREPDLDVDRAEISVEHTPEQTLIVAELPNGSVAAAVDVGDLTVENTVELGRTLKDAIRDATTPASGGES